MYGAISQINGAGTGYSDTLVLARQGARAGSAHLAGLSTDRLHWFAFLLEPRNTRGNTDSKKWTWKSVFTVCFSYAIHLPIQISSSFLWVRWLREQITGSKVSLCFFPHRFWQKCEGRGKRHPFARTWEHLSSKCVTSPKLIFLKYKIKKKKFPYRVIEETKWDNFPNCNMNSTNVNFVAT